MVDHMTFEAKIKPWGNSLGITLPKEELAKRGFKTGDVVHVSLGKRSGSIMEAFGALDMGKKTNKSTMQLLKEARKDMRSKWD